MENKKLTQDELQEISSLRQEFDSLVGNLGLIEFKILKLELQKSEIKKIPQSFKWPIISSKKA